jgi:hypothetical protein
MLVLSGDVLDLCEYYCPWVIFVHKMHITQQILNPLAALWISADAGPVYILPGLSGAAWWKLSLLHSYLRIFQWRLRALYGLKPREAARLACLLIRMWDLFSLNSGTFLFKYVNLISDILRTQKIRRNWKPAVPNVCTNVFPVLRRVWPGVITNGKT